MEASKHVTVCHKRHRKTEANIEKCSKRRRDYRYDSQKRFKSFNVKFIRILHKLLKNETNFLNLFMAFYIIIEIKVKVLINMYIVILNFAYDIT